MRYLRLLLPLGGIFLFYQLLVNLSWNKFWLAWGNLASWKLIFVFFCGPLGIFIKSSRWVLLLDMATEQRKLARGVFLASIFYGMVTPGRLGEFVKIAYLKDLGFAYRKGIFYTVYDRIFDVGVLATFSLIASYLFGVISLRLLITLLFIVVCLSYLHRQIYAWYESNPLNWFKYLKLIFLTLSSYSVYALGLPVLLSISDPFEFMKSALAVFVGNFVALIPISLNGIGTREASYYFLMDSIPREVLILASISHFFVAFFGTVLYCSMYLGVGTKKLTILKVQSN